MAATEETKEGAGWKATIDDECLSLIIEVDLANPAVPSASGKSEVIATTKGFVALGGVAFGLNVIKSKKR